MNNSRVDKLVNIFSNSENSKSFNMYYQEFLLDKKTNRETFANWATDVASLKDRLEEYGSEGWKIAYAEAMSVSEDYARACVFSVSDAVSETVVDSVLNVLENGVVFVEEKSRAASDLRWLIIGLVDIFIKLGNDLDTQLKYLAFLNDVIAEISTEYPLYETYYGNNAKDLIINRSADLLVELYGEKEILTHINRMLKTIKSDDKMVELFVYVLRNKIKSGTGGNPVPQKVAKERELARKKEKKHSSGVSWVLASVLLVFSCCLVFLGISIIYAQIDNLEYKRLYQEEQKKVEMAEVQVNQLQEENESLKNILQEQGISLETEEPTSTSSPNSVSSGETVTAEPDDSNESGVTAYIKEQCSFVDSSWEPLMQLEEGTEIVVLSENEEWLEITYSDDDGQSWTGYVKEKYVTKTKD